MVNYQKYMFNDFVVKQYDDDVECVYDKDNQESTEGYEETVETENILTEEATEENVERLEDDFIQQEDVVVQQEDEPVVFEAVKHFSEPEITKNVITYTQEELDDAVLQAKDVAYKKGQEEVTGSLLEQQNILLEDIKNQLMAIFASLEDKKADIEISSLNFAVSLIEKIMPTIERGQAEKEVKNFLAENFANFSSQETLSFSFNPDMLSHISGSIRRLAEQNDFEGKISVHKDISLGLSDCRVEWKSGGVERKTSNIMDKVKNLININKQERENG